MEFSFRDLVELLEIDAPVHFTPKEKLNRKDYVFCKYMGNDECAAIITGNHDMNTQYDGSDVGLHFPDIGIEEYFELENFRNPVGIQTHIREVGSLMCVNLEDIPVVFAVHCILHEYGHWLYFKKTGLTAYEFCQQEKKERQPYENIAREIYNMPDWHPSKWYYAERYDEQIYSKFSSEQEANKYALDHIEDAMRTVFENQNR